MSDTCAEPKPAARRTVWIVTTGEPLPIDPRARLLRSGRLALALAENGDQVVWWTSTFDHTSKSHLFPEDHEVSVQSDLTLVLLHAPSYSKNVSLARLVNHRLVTRKFRRGALTRRAPSVIVASMPTIDLAAAAVDVGREIGVPVILDVRDIWPDAIASLLHPLLRTLAAPALFLMRSELRRALRGAGAIAAVSEGYLQWAMRHAGRAPGNRDAVIPLGYHRPRGVASEASAASLRRKGVDFDRPVCVFSGSFGHSYDLHTVVEAARLLSQGGDSRIQFVIAGQGEWDDILRRAAAGLDSVVFTGWLDAQELWELLRRSRIGLMPYFSGAPQGLPNKLFEYMSVGLPIVSSLQGEAQRFLQRHGIGAAYPPSDPSALAATLQCLVGSPDALARMHQASVGLFDREFEGRKVTADFVRLINRVVGSRPGRPARSQVLRAAVQ